MHELEAKINEQLDGTCTKVRVGERVDKTGKKLGGLRAVFLTDVSIFDERIASTEPVEPEAELKNLMLEDLQRIDPTLTKRLREAVHVLGINGVAVLVGSTKSVTGLNYRTTAGKEVQLKPLVGPAPSMAEAGTMASTKANGLEGG